MSVVTSPTEIYPYNKINTHVLQSTTNDHFSTSFTSVDLLSRNLLTILFPFVPMAFHHFRENDLTTSLTIVRFLTLQITAPLRNVTWVVPTLRFLITLASGIFFGTRFGGNSAPQCFGKGSALIPGETFGAGNGTGNSIDRVAEPG
jgi:hypothetical protein